MSRLSATLLPQTRGSLTPNCLMLPAMIAGPDQAQRQTAQTDPTAFLVSLASYLPMLHC
jgi:hypothetical protein